MLKYSSYSKDEELVSLKSIKDELSLFQKLLKGIAAQFGTQCEVVLHDYSEDYNHTIIAIENGAVTGRKVGDCGTNLGLEILRGLAKEEEGICSQPAL